MVTGGQVHDSQVVEEILNTPRSPLAVTADKAYDSEKVRQQIRDEGALPVIPSRCTATKKAYCPKRIYRRRHKIENFFCRIKNWRRIATRYDKLARAGARAVRHRRIPQKRQSEHIVCIDCSFIFEDSFSLPRPRYIILIPMTCHSITYEVLALRTSIS
jgi:transposase